MVDRMTVRPPTPGELQRLLQREGLQPRRSLSQNFLTDGDALDSIVGAADLTAGDRILEIGPGLGVLTRRLLAAGCEVTAVEIDAGLAAYLRREIGTEPRLTLVEGDALGLDPQELYPEGDYKVVANIPYHITSPLLHLFLGCPNPPSLSVLLVQREVAERVAAPPGSMSYLSVFVQNIAEAAVVARVPAASFEPSPDVDSAILRLIRRPRPAVPLDDDRDGFHRIVQAGFRQRRKQVHNGLSRELPLERPVVEAALAHCAIAPDRRPQTLTVDEWVCLFGELGPPLASMPA